MMLHCARHCLPVLHGHLFTAASGIHSQPHTPMAGSLQGQRVAAQPAHGAQTGQPEAGL